ncbi:MULTISPECIES: cytochrome c oxidase assembly protein [Halobacillus]|uniref:cytochrome c oxidase assembly protein n=1 Tax=Halobacillus TaxID=45667 RepID=UPI0013D86AD4|nr:MULTISPECIES: cytochrome c oxidase assembly protein [Halobacillus]
MKVKNRLNILGLTLFLFIFLPIQAFAHNPDVRATGEGNLFQQYTWFEILNPILLLSLIVVYIAYLRTMRKISKKRLGERNLRKKICFLLGLLTIYITLAGPLAILSNNLVFSAHMLQTSLMYIVMPPLILLGMPQGFYHFLDEKIFKPKILRILKSPLINLILFNALWSFYHIPSIYEYFLEEFILLEILHIVLNTSAFLMWIQVLAPEGQINDMSYLKKLGYMFANGLLITPACALIIFGGDVIYPSIFESPQLFPWLGPLQDQRLGGIIMKVVQEFSYGTAITYVFFKWARLERAKDAQIDELPEHFVNE